MAKNPTPGPVITPLGTPEAPPDVEATTASPEVTAPEVPAEEPPAETPPAETPAPEVAAPEVPAEAPAPPEETPAPEAPTPPADVPPAEDPATPPSSPVSDPIQDTPVVSVPEVVAQPIETKGGIRIALEKLKRAGKAFGHLFTSEDAEAELSDAEVPPLDLIEWEVEDENPGTAPVVAYTTDGWYKAVVNADGSGVLTAFAPPNAHNRAAGVVTSDDQKLMFGSLSVLEELIAELIDTVDPIFDSSLAAIKQKDLDRKAAVAAQQTPEAHQEMTATQLRKQTIAVLAHHFGLDDFITPGNDYKPGLPSRLAAGLDLKSPDTELADEALLDRVLVEAEAAGLIERPTS